jgi:uncharacterized protein involved in exopolysaccharide biosynthesis
MEDEINLRDYLRVMQKRWKIIVVAALALMGWGYLSSIRQVPLYQAATTVLMREGGGGSSFSKMAGLAELVGMKLPGNRESGDMINLIESRAVAGKVVEDLKLRQRIEGWNDPEIADHKLASAVKGLIRPQVDGNMIELRVEYTDPQLTAEIADAYVDALTYFWNELNYTEAQKKREYIESQLPRVETELSFAKNKLKNFSLLGFSEMSIELEMLKSEFDIQNAVYQTLRKEYVAVKLEESKEIPLFSVLDRALVPERPINTKSRLHLIMGLVMGTICGTCLAFFAEYWEKTGKT